MNRSISLRRLRVGIAAVIAAAIVAVPGWMHVQSAQAALPASAWWLVLHDPCDDTLHWISAAGEFAAIPRPTLPDEAAGAPCSARVMHISQNGRYLVQAARLTNAQIGLGFYDLQAGEWLQVHQAQPGENVYLGARYASDRANRIAIGFANALDAARTWRMIVFDMATGDVLDQLRSDGAQIAAFGGAEFLATAPVVPTVLLLTDDGRGGVAAHIRFDALDDGAEPYGAAAWYPAGAPGVAQELVSSPLTASDIDVLPDRRAIVAYSDRTFAPDAITTNAIGTQTPASANDLFPATQLFYADAASTLFDAMWAADGRIALFRASDGAAIRLHYVRVGTALLRSLDGEVTQVIGVPTGFVYSAGDGIYFMGEHASEPQGPVFSDPMLSDSAVFVWATAFGDPALALDMPAMPEIPAAATNGAPPPPTLTPASTPAPDLFVSAIKLTPEKPDQGAPVDVQVSIVNGGAANAGPFEAAWYAGASYPAPACTWVVEELAASGVLTLTCTYAGYPSPYASIDSQALVDTTNAVTESDEANNSLTLPVTVLTPAVVLLPDLTVSAFRLRPVTPVQGEPVDVRVTIANQGRAVAGSFQVQWVPGGGSTAPACNWIIDRLAPASERVLTCTYAGFPQAHEAINTRVLVDPAGRVDECRETNNTHLEKVSVRAR